MSPKIWSLARWGDTKSEAISQTIDSYGREIHSAEPAYSTSNYTSSLGGQLCGARHGIRAPFHRRRRTAPYVCVHRGRADWRADWNSGRSRRLGRRRSGRIAPEEGKLISLARRGRKDTSNVKNNLKEKLPQQQIQTDDPQHLPHGAHGHGESNDAALRVSHLPRTTKTKKTLWLMEDFSGENEQISVREWGHGEFRKRHSGRELDSVDGPGSTGGGGFEPAGDRASRGRWRPRGVRGETQRNGESEWERGESLRVRVHLVHRESGRISRACFH
jgi:hypothetical protein